MSCSAKLAKYIYNLSYDDLSRETILKTEHCFTDWIGAVINAGGHATSESYVDFATRMGGAGDSSILGYSHKTSLPWAAFANGALGHITEVDDGHRMSIMHIGTVVLPVVFAYAEKFGLSGRHMIEAAVCGYDLAIRVGECLGKDHYTIWHTTATAGTFGATAAAAKLLGLDEGQIVSALGHCGTQAAGLWQFLLDGKVEAKPLHPGKAVFNGIVAAELAAQGIEGPEHIFEGDKGFCRANSPHYDLNCLTDGLGTHFKVDEVNFKGYPTCGQTHSMIDATKKIMELDPFAPEDVDRVEALVYQKAIDVAGIRNPSSLEQAKFSNPFCMAAVIAKGDINFRNLSVDDLNDDVIKGLMSRVELRFDPEIDSKFPKCRPCRVTVYLKDGSALTAENFFRKGDPETPMDRADMEDKFEQLTEKHISREKRETILKWIYSLENLEAYSDIF